MRASALRFLSFGLLSCACAFTGYDFDDYTPAAGGAAASSRKQPSAGEAGAPADGGSPAENGGAKQGGGGEDGGGGQGGEAGARTDCKPLDCLELQSECGLTDDGCGNPLDCGGCFWWFEECRQNVCEITE